MQFSEVEFTNPLFDGSVSPTGHTNYQPDVTPCSNDYGTVDISGGYESAVGGIPPQPTTNTPTPVTTTNTPSTTTPSAPTTSPSTPSVTPITTPSTQKESPSTSSLPVVTNNLSIKITGTDGSVIVGAKVVLDTGQSTTTNSNGMASFRGVTSGSHKVMVTMPGYTTVQTKADILSSQTSKQLTIRLAALRSPISLYIYSGIILVLLVCFGYITKVIIHRKVSRNHPESAVKTVVVSEAPTLVKFPDKALLTAKPPIPLGTLAVNQPWVKPTAQLPLDNQLPEETTPEQPNEPPQLPTSPA